MYIIRPSKYNFDFVQSQMLQTIAKIIKLYVEIMSHTNRLKVVIHGKIHTAQYFLNF